MSLILSYCGVTRLSMISNQTAKCYTVCNASILRSMRHTSYVTTELQEGLWRSQVTNTEEVAKWKAKRDAGVGTTGECRLARNLAPHYIQKLLSFGWYVTLSLSAMREWNIILAVVSLAIFIWITMHIVLIYIWDTKKKRSLDLRLPWGRIYRELWCRAGTW